MTTSTPPASTPPSPPAADAPGPAPTASCGINLGELVERDSGQSTYVAYVPKSYTGSPTRLLVGLHGCGDGAWNFATWGVNPYDTRDGQDYIGIAIDGASGGGNCWSGDDEAKVLAAIDDIASCVYVHKQKVVIAGFSSGGMLAYQVGLAHAERFAGILIENAELSWTGNADGLLAGASWKIPVAHRAHTEDTVATIDVVHDDWQKLQSAGFPVTTSEVAGGHDGSSQDWTEWLLPRMETWKSR
jgi:pimeloyl-ACP methyl ester carboxylesterase